MQASKICLTWRSDVRQCGSAGRLAPTGDPEQRYPERGFACLFSPYPMGRSSSSAPRDGTACSCRAIPSDHLRNHPRTVGGPARPCDGLVLNPSRRAPRRTGGYSAHCGTHKRQGTGARMRNHVNAPAPPWSAPKGGKTVEKIPWHKARLRPGDRVAVEIARGWWGYATGIITHCDHDGGLHFRCDGGVWPDCYLTWQRVIVLERAQEIGGVR